ncbi:MAG: hypothetical protein HN368_01570, partial [Spirochaetales bacterium]|nr:hypothetical protein [Spirochaetales bacterium]
KSIDSKVSRLITQIIGEFGSNIEVPGREGWHPILVANSHSFSRDDLISYFPKAEGGVYTVSDAFDNELRVETDVTTAGSPVVSFLPEMPLPPMSINVFYIKRTDTDSYDLQDLSDRPFVLENSCLKAELDSITGNVISLYLKNPGHEFIPRRHPGNHIEIYEDANNYAHGPDHRWDPWHISFSERKFAPVGTTSVIWKKYNSVRQTVVVSRKMDLCPGMGPTVFEQEITLREGSPVLEFHSYGIWSAAEAFLKAEFHLNLEADTHICEMPYGVSERSNVPPDKKVIDDQSALEDLVKAGDSRPEPDLPMQRWLDYSDDIIGLAFLNDGKYGYDIDGHRVRLSLMRAPLIRSGEIAGLGAFDFAYALYPHAGRWSGSDVVKNAQVLNRPLRALCIPAGTENIGEQRPPGWKIGEPLIELNSPDVHISAMKAAEADPGYIVRLWACTDKPQELSIRISFPINQVFLCNALEQNLEEVRFESGSQSTIKLSFKPLEFKTLKLVCVTAIF